MTAQAPADRDAWAQGLLELLGPRARETPGLQEGVLEVVSAASDAEVSELLERLQSTGDSWDLHASQSLARELSNVVLGAMLVEGSTLEHSELLEPTRGRPVILVGNHLSFVDANVFDRLLRQAGFEELADRLVVIVGPKVFSTPLRRVASLCFGTIKTPQSSSRASGEAVMSPRDVARTAAQTMRVARECIEKGSGLLIFVEGTRSRTGGMQRALAGVARYLDRADALVVPFGLWGSDRLIPIGSNEQFHPARVMARVGRPLDASLVVERCTRKRALIMDTLGFLIADCLPAGNRGVYTAGDGPLAEARTLATELSA